MDDKYNIYNMAEHTFYIKFRQIGHTEIEDCYIKAHDRKMMIAEFKYFLKERRRDVNILSVRQIN